VREEEVRGGYLDVLFLCGGETMIMEKRGDSIG
jgi:hypothetical protein